MPWEGQDTEALAAAKALVRRYHAHLEAAADPLEALTAALSPTCLWRGMHPFYEQVGPDAVAETFFRPLTQSLTALQRRTDVFMAGFNEIDDFQSIWVVSMGHFMGLFDRPFLNIPPTGRIAMMRFAEFAKVENGQITEIAQFVDIPQVMVQAGLQPFAMQTGAELIQPGPRTHEAVMYGPQDPSEGAETLRVINAMITDLGSWNLGLPLEEELARTWVNDMIWWGPTGIGSTYTIERYAKQHSGPFRASFTDRTRTGHLCRMAEGHFGGFFGWPNFTARSTGGFMGMPPSETPIPFRVVDIYRRRSDKLVENWVFIDLLHAWHSLGVDILGRLPQVLRRAP